MLPTRKNILTWSIIALVFASLAIVFDHPLFAVLAAMAIMPATLLHVQNRAMARHENTQEVLNG